MKKPSPYLTFAGAIPFVAAAIWITLGVDAIFVLGNTADILSAYGVVIASFMAGSHWGTHLSLTADNAWALRLPIFSNAIAVLLWLGFLSLSVVGFIWLLVLGFIALLAIDYGLCHVDIISKQYFKIRVSVTWIVVLSLIVAAVQL